MTLLTSPIFRINAATRSVHQWIKPLDSFPRRHIGPVASADLNEMLHVVQCNDLSHLVKKAVPSAILYNKPLALGPGRSESQLLKDVKSIADKNLVYKSFIGQGYYNTNVPPVIQRNILENPGWYTQYTPYQPEISQGRLESLLNFQTMVSDMTGLPVSNASLLDEATAAAEAMIMTWTAGKRKRNTFFVDQNVFSQTLAVLQTRARGFHIKLVVGDYSNFDFQPLKDDLMGVLIQYPCANGALEDYKDFCQMIHELNAQVTCATDLLALTLLKPPGEWGADISFGSTQRLGVPLGYGGPHAAFFACTYNLKRLMPGRLIGVTRDSNGNVAYRLALQTREQHIRREKATSNICTAQALLANMAAMYAVYHGPAGLKDIATRAHLLTCILAHHLVELGHTLVSKTFFDTLCVHLKGGVQSLITLAQSNSVNFGIHANGEHVTISLDETTTIEDVALILSIFARATPKQQYLATTTKDRFFESYLSQFEASSTPSPAKSIPDSLVRASKFLEHKVFNLYHSETEMLRYIRRLESKDLSLCQAMIPLGSCTMKLNATVEMMPVTMDKFSNMHPFAPLAQAKGYAQLISELEYALAECTGFSSVSLQPNSGAQGEYTGLSVIRAFHESQNQTHRDVCLIPFSAHGTNPASAVMAGLKVVTVQCDELGNLDMADLKAKATEHKDKLAAIMVTYPSTFGVFDEGIQNVCDIIHANGGQVYMDGANLNAQIGLCRPGDYGADVCHLNLHKTFTIPHGGGGPGVGPIAVASHLVPFLPKHIYPMFTHDRLSKAQCMGPVSAAPYGSASILPISWAYIKLMGADGLRRATEMAILNANYLMKRLEKKYEILYTNVNGLCAHEFILDTRPFSDSAGVEAVDIAKRLHDYGFHSPTMSWPIVNTLMIEPTESESKNELDRFADALLSIRDEISLIEQGQWPKDNNPLVNAPHTVSCLLSTTWDKPYTRMQAAYPVPSLLQYKFWPSVGRVDDLHGDKNLVCRWV